MNSLRNYESIQRAVAEEAAARAILLDRDAWDHLAVPHLLAAWNALLDPNQTQEQEPLSSRLASLRHPSLNQQRREQLTMDLAVFEKQDQAQNGPNRKQLCSNLALLYACINQTRGRARLWIIRGAVFFGITLFIVCLIWLFHDTSNQVRGEYQPHGWIAQYYPQPNFRGNAVVQIDPRVEFDWHEDAPQKGFGRDRFSIQWDSCLQLKAAQEVLFQVGSDDGSRLFLNGRQVIDNWRDQGGAWESFRTRLEAGVHHVRVQYYENLGSAFVVLKISGTQYDIPPSSYLTPHFDGKRIGCLVR